MMELSLGGTRLCRQLYMRAAWLALLLCCSHRQLTHVVHIVHVLHGTVTLAQPTVTTAHPSFLPTHTYTHRGCQPTKVVCRAPPQHSYAAARPMAAELPHLSTTM